MRLKTTGRLPALKTAALFLFLSATLHAQDDHHYSQEVFFEISTTPDSYFYSIGKTSAPSTLRLIDGKLSVETAQYVSGPNALELTWRSVTDGGWDAELNLYRWRNRDVNWNGEDLYLWLWIAQGISAAELPRIAFIDLENGHTAPLPLSEFTTDLPAVHWIRVRIPLGRFASASLRPFVPRRLTAMVLSQGIVDEKPHTLYIDDMRIETDLGLDHLPKPPTNLEARGYERRIDLHWNGADDPTIAQYVIYRSLNSGPYKAIGIQRYGVDRYADYIGDDHATASYRVSARTSTLAESAKTDEATAKTHPMTDDELLSIVEEASFRYCWEGGAGIGHGARVAARPRRPYRDGGQRFRNHGHGGRGGPRLYLSASMRRAPAADHSLSCPC
jgi:hypothetical protein